MESILSKFNEYIGEGVPGVAFRLLGVFLLLIIGFWVIGIFNRAVKKHRSFAKLDPSVAAFLRSFISIALKAMLVVTAIAVLGVPLSAIVAAVGSVGLAIGLALQGSLSNFAGGVMILIFKPFKLEDYVSVGESEGTVKDIGIFYTTVLTADGKRIVMPNASVSNSTLTNFTAVKTRRVDLNFGVAYGSNMDKVKNTLIETAKRHPKVLSDPPIMARLIEQKDSALIYTLRAWCESDDYLDVKFDLNEAAIRAFEANGISIPFPQLDVHMKER